VWASSVKPPQPGGLRRRVVAGSGKRTPLCLTLHVVARRFIEHLHHVRPILDGPERVQDDGLASRCANHREPVGRKNV
jgi:hypothetical protein